MATTWHVPPGNEQLQTTSLSESAKTSLQDAISNMVTELI